MILAPGSELKPSLRDTHAVLVAILSTIDMAFESPTLFTDATQGSGISMSVLEKDSVQLKDSGGSDL